MKKTRKLENISLTSYDDIFSTDKERNVDADRMITEVSIVNLRSFKNHPFKLYEGSRFTEMVESVKENGVMLPIIVRPIADETYEILSGHNRVEAAKAAGLETIPAIIRENLSDEEAMLIVTETNLIQRSFADLSHSERAAALAAHHEAIKNQGKRTDLINEIETLLKNSEKHSNNADFETSAHIGRKLESREKVGQQYNLSKNSVARYLRINKLPDFFKKYLDENRIVFLAAVELSYMTSQNQHDLSEILSGNPEFKIDIKKAGLLRELSKDGKLTRKVIEDILAGVALKRKKANSFQTVKIQGRVLSKYFKPEQKPEEIQTEIIKALEFYREHKNSEKT